ncbi:MAG: hypothetical protein H0Z33_01390 [Bacillaceae bacterium]|nr:hypothetical protein [Bacillaceae bacterium]
MLAFLIFLFFMFLVFGSVIFMLYQMVRHDTGNYDRKYLWKNIDPDRIDEEI